MEDHPTGRILIVDDNREHQEALGRVFTQAGYCVVGLASNGEDALALLASGPVDLILTAFGDYISYAEAVESGAFQFLNKPVRRADILALARTAVRKARALESVIHGDPGNGGCPADAKPLA